MSAQTHDAPESVAIVAMGSSNADWLAIAANRGHPEDVVDEVWAINAMAAVIFHDRAFVMDDVKHIITAQSEEDEPRKVARGILKWLPDHPGPVYTTTPYDEWPALVEYPLADVLGSIAGVPYINNSVAYAVAYAIHIGVKRLVLFGCDFTYPDAHISESGRGSVEFLLGYATALGVAIEIPMTSTLMDGTVPVERKLYGFHEPIVPVVEDGEVRLLRGEECMSSATSSQ